MYKLLFLLVFMVGCTAQPKFTGLTAVELTGPKGEKCTGLVYDAAVPVPVTKKTLGVEYESVAFYYRVDHLTCGGKSYRPFMVAETAIRQPDMFDESYKQTHKFHFFVQKLKSFF